MTGLAIELESTAGAAQEARVVIRERLVEVLPATTLYDLLTVVSELVTNGVRHGQGDTVRVRLSLAADGNVNGEVENDGRGRVELRPIDTTGTTGIGLHIVSTIADRWRVFVDDSTRVRFELVRP